MTHKNILVWVAGGLLMLAGAWIIGNLELTVGVSPVSYYLALLGALIFFLLAGLCWISVAVATRGHHHI